MLIPGFTAEAALQRSGQYWRRASTGDHDRGPVMPQLRGSAFHRPRTSGTFGTIEDYYTCKQGCETARSSCLNTCEGTWENPRGSTNCTLCGQDYRACMAGCSRDIA